MTQTQLEVGHTLSDQWLIIDIKKGGMGLVYLCRSVETGSLRAIKTVRLLDGPTGDEFRRRFVEEVRSWIALSDRSHHANIVQALHYDVVQNLLFLEYVEGLPLTAVAPKVPVHPEQATDWAIGIARGMEVLHRDFQMVHRDLKPDNILISQRDLVPKVTDLGIAKVIQEEAAQGTIAGTRGYMAPETYEGIADFRSDIWCYGAVLYRMVTGAAPFENKIPLEGKRPPQPYEVNPAVAPAVNDLVMRCLEYHPEARCQTFGEILEVLESLPTVASVVDDSLFRYCATHKFHSPVGEDLPQCTLCEYRDGFEASLTLATEISRAGASGAAPVAADEPAAADEPPGALTQAEGEAVTEAAYEAPTVAKERVPIDPTVALAPDPPPAPPAPPEPQPAGGSGSSRRGLWVGLGLLPLILGAVVYVVWFRGDAGPGPEVTQDGKGTGQTEGTSPVGDGEETPPVQPSDEGNVEPDDDKPKEPDDAGRGTVTPSGQGTENGGTKTDPPDGSGDGEKIGVPAEDPGGEKDPAIGDGDNDGNNDGSPGPTPEPEVVVMETARITLDLRLPANDSPTLLGLEVAGGQQLAQSTSFEVTLRGPRAELRAFKEKPRLTLEIPSPLLSGGLDEEISLGVGAEADVDFHVEGTPPLVDWRQLRVGVDLDDLPDQVTTEFHGELRLQRRAGIRIGDVPDDMKLEIVTGGQAQPMAASQVLPGNMCTVRATREGYVSRTVEVQLTVGEWVSVGRDRFEPWESTAAVVARAREVFETLDAWRSASVADRRQACETMALTREGLTHLGPAAGELGLGRFSLDDARLPQPLELILVPGGEFTMGASEGDELARPEEKPALPTQVEPFFISAFEVTEAQWDGVMKGPGGTGGNRPVLKVSWEDARSFCSRLGLELPTERQWEYAGRGGSATRYFFGDDRGPLSEYAIYQLNPEPVGQRKPNGFGLHDVHGNAAEWCRDWYRKDLADLLRAEETGAFDVPPPGREPTRSVRGGGYKRSYKFLRTSARDGCKPADPRLDSGFRPVLPLSD